MVGTSLLGHSHSCQPAPFHRFLEDVYVEVVGRYDGQSRQSFIVVREDGNLTGNDLAVFRILMEAANLEGQLVGPVGQQTETKHLNSALSALIIIDRVLTEAVYTGEVPKAGSVPPGAVI